MWRRSENSKKNEEKEREFQRKRQKRATNIQRAEIELQKQNNGLLKQLFDILVKRNMWHTLMFEVYIQCWWSAIKTG